MNTLSKLIFTFSLLCMDLPAFPQQCDDGSNVEISGILALGEAFEIGIGIHRDRPIRHRPRPQRRVIPRHNLSFPACPVYGDLYEEWEDGESIVGIDLSDTDPVCAEACFDETVYDLSFRYGPPHEESQEYHCGEIELSAVWEMRDEILTVLYFEEDGERTLEVVSEVRGRCDW